MNCSALNAHLFIRNLVESQNCICGITETVSHFSLDCPRHTTVRQQLFFSLLDIPETISLNLLIFGSVNLRERPFNLKGGGGGGVMVFSKKNSDSQYWWKKYSDFGGGKTK
jgi:hypothetical protein